MKVNTPQLKKLIASLENLVNDESTKYTNEEKARFKEAIEYLKKYESNQNKAFFLKAIGLIVKVYYIIYKILDDD